jgi:hypothetical protein
LPLERLEKAAALPDLQPPVRPPPSLQHPARIVDRIHQRFGADHMLAGLERPHDVLAMQVIGGIDDHDVDIVASQYLVVVRGKKEIGMVTPGFVQLFLREIASGNRARVRRPVESGQQGLPFIEPHHADAQLAIGRFGEHGPFGSGLEVVGLTAHVCAPEVDGR